jgi:hypothetical protein
MPRIDDYKAARALAQAALATRNPKHVADKSKSEFVPDEGQGGLIVPYFGQPRRVVWPEIEVTPVDGDGELPLTEQILILHYLQRATGEPVSGVNIDFRAVPEGSFYWSAFVSRAKKPLLEMFGRDPDFYAEVADFMGGAPVALGDVARQFQALPLVPVTHVLWRGDDEFEPDAGILFDETIPEHLSTEDIAALAGASVYRLMAAARQVRQKK